jgi:lysozyme
MPSVKVLTRTAAALLTLSMAGIGFIMQHEGTVLKAYPDVIGVSTICTGHTKGVELGQVATMEECEQYLAEDAANASKDVARCTTQPVTQGQFDALVSLTFNIGGKNYCNSTLVKKINRGDCVGAANEFSRWVYADGRKLNGLVKRRADEKAIFLKDCER